MSYIKAHKKGGELYYQEVEAYRDDNGNKQHRLLRTIGKELPKELNGVPIGYHGAKLVEGKRVQVHKVKLGMEDFLGEHGMIKQLRQKYALIIFDKPIRRRNDWLFPFEMLGNIKRTEVIHDNTECN